MYLRIVKQTTWEATAKKKGAYSETETHLNPPFMWTLCRPSPFQTPASSPNHISAEVIIVLGEEKRSSQSLKVA